MADLSRKERIPTKNTKNTRGNARENTSESLKPTRTITHVLDPRNTKRYTIHNQQGTIHRVTGSSP